MRSLLLAGSLAAFLLFGGSQLIASQDEADIAPPSPPAASGETTATEGEVVVSSVTRSRIRIFRRGSRRGLGKRGCDGSRRMLMRRGHRRCRGCA